MNASTHDELPRAEQSLEQGECMDTLRQVKELTSTAELSKEELLAYVFFESCIRIPLGETDKALALAKEIEKKSMNEERPADRGCLDQQSGDFLAFRQTWHTDLMINKNG
ncbi:MAG: hypothetical protein A2Z14_12520 [Chloroflexi bacterium RBG_16_48_8]|nr:MAG: hypothetical protein A2Z14_12520 [Chloroflexi bacterium RBG_16_48_8]